MRVIPASSGSISSAATRASITLTPMARANCTAILASTGRPFFHRVKADALKPALSAASWAVIPFRAPKTKAYQAVTSYRAKRLFPSAFFVVQDLLDHPDPHGGDVVRAYEAEDCPHALNCPVHD